MNKQSKLMKEAALMAMACCGTPITEMVKVKIGSKTFRKEIIDKKSGKKHVTKDTIDEFRFQPKLRWAGQDGLFGYLIWFAQTYPKEFMASIGSKILPIQIAQGDEDDTPIESETRAETMERLRKEGLPNTVREAITSTVFAFIEAKRKGETTFTFDFSDKSPQR